MKTMQLSCIVNDFTENIGNSKRAHFINCFNKFLQKKYGKIKMNSFYKDYQKLVVKAAKILDSSYELSLETLKKRFYRILNDPSYDCIKSANKSTFNIPRLTVIHIAFVLTDKMNRDIDRLSVANELLLSLGYPQLRASSLIEIFIIHALNQQLSYDSCVRKYNDFLQKTPHCVDGDTLFSKTTTTVFQTQICNKKYQNDDELFEDISLLVNSMRDISLKTKDTFCKTLENIKEKRRMSKIRVQCEFFLTFVNSSKKAQEIFNQQFPITASTGKTRDAYFAEIDAMSLEGMNFIPISKKDSQKPFSVRTIVDALDMVEKGKGMFSREAYLLWLLYCGYDAKRINFEISSRYEPLNPGVYFDRYVMMIGSFSLHKTESGSFSVKYEDAFEKNESFIIEDDMGTLDITNDFALRQSVIEVLTAGFDRNFAAERFVNSKDSALDKIV